jgi:hypothetical protein
LTTLSKIGLVLVAAGLSWVAGPGADLPGWLIAGTGVVLAFGPDLTAKQANRRHRRRLLAERVAGWEAEIVHVKDISHLLLRLTPPTTEEVDSSIGCQVLLPDGDEAEASQYVAAWMPTGEMQSNVVPPHQVKAEGKWNDYYYVMFPDSFRILGGIARLGHLPPGDYIVTWSRDHGFGRQILRRCTFAIENNGLFAEE